MCQSSGIPNLAVISWEVHGLQAAEVEIMVTVLQVQQFQHSPRHQNLPIRPQLDQPRVQVPDPRLEMPIRINSPPEEVSK